MCREKCRITRKTFIGIFVDFLLKTIKRHTMRLAFFLSFRLLANHIEQYKFPSKCLVEFECFMWRRKSVREKMKKRTIASQYRRTKSHAPSVYNWKRELERKKASQWHTKKEETKMKMNNFMTDHWVLYDSLSPVLLFRLMILQFGVVAFFSSSLKMMLI